MTDLVILTLAGVVYVVLSNLVTYVLFDRAIRSAMRDLRDALPLPMGGVNPGDAVDGD